MRPLYIFDLDGTLANIDHRLKYIDRPKGERDYTAFYAACVDDKPNAKAIQTMNELNCAGCDVWIFTGRSEEVRSQTAVWLTQNTVFNGARSVLKMRKAGDHRPDHALKKSWLDEMSQEDRDRLVGVFEDRGRVVRMWRANRVACFQVADGNF